MNVNDPLFTDLALKVIAGRASEAEQSELAARVASHPELEAELESLRADVSFAREVLPLLGDEQVKAAELPGYSYKLVPMFTLSEDEQVKAAELPGYALARLHAAVKRSFGNRASPQTTSKAAVGEMVRQWRWWFGFGTAVAAAVILVSLNWPRLTGNTARNVNSKPLVQLAMLDSMGQTRGAVAGAAGSEFLKNLTLGAPQENLQLSATLKESLQQTNLMLFSEKADLKKWLAEWPSDNEQPAFKVWYDRDAGEVRVLGRRRGKQQTEQRFPVGKERDLPAVLREVVAAFGQTPPVSGGSK